MHLPRLALVWLLFPALACSDDAHTAPRDPNLAPKASIDRFSGAAGTLMVRTAQNGLPGPNQPIDFDQPPFVTQGLGPQGQVVRYYNFDVKSTTPAPIYALFDGDTPVANQLNIVDAIPGDAGYNDFWLVMKVAVPKGYVANTVTSLADIRAAGYPITATNMIVNCPIVPDRSTATMRLDGGATALVRGWYRGQVVEYFTFAEKPLVASADGRVPLSPIFVSFNVNPDQPGGGPPSGFRMEPSSEQTHNVVGTLPSEDAYSPLWGVSVYDNADFAMVHDLASASAAHRLGEDVAMVNCPIVSIH